MKKLMAVFMLLMVSPAAFAATNPWSVDFLGTTLTLPMQKARGGFYFNLKDKATYTGAQTMIAGWGAKDQNGDRAIELSMAGIVDVGKHKRLPALVLDGKLSKRFFDTSNNTLYWGAWGWVQKDAKGANKPVGGMEANFLFW